MGHGGLEKKKNDTYLRECLTSATRLHVTNVTILQGYGAPEEEEESLLFKHISTV
jgi:DNA-nicking Smr family endonuclease